MRKIGSILLPAICTLLLGCASTPTKPLQLKIAVNDIYCTDTACFCVHDVAARGYFQTLEKLKEEQGVELNFTYFIEPYQLETAILSGEFDGVLSKPWIALRLQQQADADFERILDLVDPAGNRELSGIVIVPTASSIQTLEELTGKHISIGEAESYEKHQAAKHLFEQRGIKPLKIDTRASCGENIGLLLDDEVDAAVISDYALSADCAVDFASPEDFRTLEHTEKIPLTSLMINRNKVSTKDIERVKQALLTHSGSAADASLLGEGFVEPAPWSPPELENQP